MLRMTVSWFHVRLSLLILVACALAAAGWWFTKRPAMMPIIETGNMAQPPDQTLENVQFISMDTSGKPGYRIDAPSMRYYVAQDRAELDEPRMQYFRPNKRPITLDAARAVVLRSKDEVQLLDDVTMERPADGEQAALKVVTRDVTVHPDTQILSTDQEVHAHSDYFQIEGRGMRANLGEETVEILSEAHGVYEPALAPR
ncbi:MAG: LPS export ABC transporter periplasmic protein LptC [Gammaproteobacteria bacterium]